MRLRPASKPKVRPSKHVTVGLLMGEHHVTSNAKEALYFDRTSRRSIDIRRRDGWPGDTAWSKILASDAQFDSLAQVQQDQRGERRSACNKKLRPKVLIRSFLYWRRLDMAWRGHPT